MRCSAQPSTARRGTAQRGQALVVLILGFTVVGILAGVSLRWRRGQARSAVDAWAYAAADALAQGGIEAARAALMTGSPVNKAPLGDPIDLGRAQGALEVSLSKAQPPAVRACATVIPRRGRPAKVCLHATLAPDAHVIDLKTAAH